MRTKELVVRTWVIFSVKKFSGVIEEIINVLHKNGVGIEVQNLRIERTESFVRRLTYLTLFFSDLLLTL